MRIRKVKVLVERDLVPVGMGRSDEVTIYGVMGGVTSACPDGD
jgi:hypothetical protein